jgi:hypothetical protein
MGFFRDGFIHRDAVLSTLGGEIKPWIGPTPISSK